MRRPSALAALAALAVLAAPASASAHATLKSSVPGVQARVDRAPAAVALTFNESVTITPRAIEVFAADGRQLAGTSTLFDRGKLVRIALRPLARGTYTVRWRATGSDGHTTAGVFNFGVGVEPPPPSQAVGAVGPSWRDDAARWGYLGALSLLVGLLGFRLLVLREPLPAALANRLSLLSVIGAFAAVDIGIAAFVIRASNALQLPFVDLLFGDLSPFATKTRFGLAFVVTTMGFGAVAALVLLFWIFDWSRLLWPAFVAGALFASGVSLSGHQATEPNATWLTQFADWLHLLAATLWIGGLVGLIACVWPLAPELRARAFLRFSRLATVLVAVLVLAGTYLAVIRLPQLSDLWSTSYGLVLLLKLAIVLVALGWGAAHHFLVRPRLEHGEPAPGGLRRSLAGESTVALLVLLVAAVLANQQPPPSGPPAPVLSASTLPR
ncbi:CopC domain [Gaiella occulta]|uniref:CopC domain n=1 Tax=Gaiella occulta TaxID=1002870 RepID=A0A7M2Z180_9ACTN|nr:CopD family protein [Gaiella occulta]RDI76097.1 CopC domain [Gaiella occulta]